MTERCHSGINNRRASRSQRSFWLSSCRSCEACRLLLFLHIPLLLSNCCRFCLCLFLCFYLKRDLSVKIIQLPPSFLWQGPFDYLPESKNPCFYDENKTFRCVPYFFQVGFSKCGTSDLYRRILQHPHVAQTKKEMQWFSRRRFPEYIQYRKWHGLLLDKYIQCSK